MILTILVRACDQDQDQRADFPIRWVTFHSRNHPFKEFLLSEAVEQVRPLLERCAHRLILPQTAGSFSVLGDRKRLIQVIANLLNNAAKYTPQGGVIQVHLESRADGVVLAVQDNGIGIE